MTDFFSSLQFGLTLGFVTRAMVNKIRVRVLFRGNQDVEMR